MSLVIEVAEHNKISGSGKNLRFDVYDDAQINELGLRILAYYVRYRPWLLKKGWEFSIGDMDYRILKVKGSVLCVGHFYTGVTSAILPITVIESGPFKFRVAVGYKDRDGYFEGSFTTKKILSHLRGETVLTK